jgi:hypothetical protein
MAAGSRSDYARELMRTSLKLLLVTMSMCALSGCWMRANQVESGQDLLRFDPAVSRLDAPVVIKSFSQLELQDFDHQLGVSAAGDLTDSYKLAPGSRDISRHVAQAVYDSGFHDVSYQPDQKGQYLVRGRVERMEMHRSGGKMVWAVLAGTVQTFTLCLLPLYFEGHDYEAMVQVEVYNKAGKLLLRERNPVEWTPVSTCFWGSVRVPDTEAVGRASGKLVADLLRYVMEQQALRGTKAEREAKD